MNLEDAREEVRHIADFFHRVGEQQLAAKILGRFDAYSHLLEQEELPVDEGPEDERRADEGAPDPDA